MGDLFWVILVGFGMGFIGSIPPLGPVTLMTINRVFNKQLKFAFVVGVGGALAEVIYSALAVTGVGLLRAKVGATREVLGLTSASILLVVGIYFLYQTHKHHSEQEPSGPDPDPDSDSDESLSADAQASDGSTFAHFARGFTVAIFNPILIVNWTVAVAYFFSLFHLQADLVGQLLFAGAVGVGKIVWTAIQVVLFDKFRQRYSLVVLQRVEKGVSIAVILSALFLFYQTLF